MQISCTHTHARTRVHCDGHGHHRCTTTAATLERNYGKFCVQLDDDSFVLSGAFTAVDGNGTQVLHRGLVHISAKGRVLQGPLLLPVQLAGRQEGFTGIALAEDGALVATGFYNGYPGYPDEAMFLVYIFLSLFLPSPPLPPSPPPPPNPPNIYRRTV